MTFITNEFIVIPSPSSRAEWVEIGKTTSMRNLDPSPSSRAEWVEIQDLFHIENL